MRTISIQVVLGVIFLTVFQSKCDSGESSSESESDEFEKYRPPNDEKKIPEKTEATMPKDYVIVGNRYIKTIFDVDYGMPYVADWTTKNGVRCDDKNEKDVEYAEKLCARSCSNNDTILTMGFCIDGWVTCVLGFNERGTMNIHMNCERRNYMKKIPDGCLSWCYWACQKDHLPTASIRPHTGKLGTAKRGCNENHMCACAPFKENFHHPIPSLKSKDIANYIEQVNTTYFKKKTELYELLFLVNHNNYG